MASEQDDTPLLFFFIKASFSSSIKVNNRDSSIAVLRAFISKRKQGYEEYLSVPHGVHWKNVDYLIFITYIWWMNTGNMKVLRGSFDEGSKEYDEVPRPIAYRRVLETWSSFVDNNIDPNRTKVFFNSMSPFHIKSEDWNNPNGIKCAKETAPILNMSTPLQVGTDHRLLTISILPDCKTEVFNTAKLIGGRRNNVYL